jgi:hypothetical protein
VVKTLSARAKAFDGEFLAFGSVLEDLKTKLLDFVV